MNTRFLLTTTAAVALATAAFAQSPSTSTNSSTTQRQQQSPAATSSGSSQTTNSATNPTPSGSAQSQAPASNSQSQNTTAGGSTNQSTGASTAQGSSSTSQTPASGSSSGQAQTNAPSNQTSPSSSQAQGNQPSSNTQTQSGSPPPSTNNQAQQSPSGSNSTNTAQQPNNQGTNQNTAERSSTNVNAQVNINDQQRTRISESVSRLDVRPLTNVNFSVSVGAVVPRDIRLQPLPDEVVQIVPQYRGYNFVLVKDEIVIVEPSSLKIVAVLPYSGRSTASAPARTERKTTFTERDREVIRKHARSRPVEREGRTTGSSTRTELRMGERVPEGVEIEAFPDEVYREAPTLREYRYINRDSHTYIVAPQDRRIIEEIE